MSDYRIEAATKEEWAARALAAEERLAQAVGVLERCLNFIANTENELGEPLQSGDHARAFLATTQTKDATE